MVLDHAGAYGAISGLVLCPVMSIIMGDAIDADSTLMDKKFVLNVRAVLDMVKEAVPYMDREGSVVVFVGSIAAYSQLPK